MRWLVGVVAVGLLSCTEVSPDPGPVGPSPSRSHPQRPLPFVRTCESSVEGDLGRGWRRGEVVAGPVVFVAAGSYADDSPRRFSARRDRGTLHKVLIVVEGDRSVEVGVRDPDAALAYDPERWGDRNRIRFDAGDQLVRFEPCGGDQRSTQFNGAFVLRAPGCVPVEVRVDGGGPSLATVSFGAGECS